MSRADTIPSTAERRAIAEREIGEYVELIMRASLAERCAQTLEHRRAARMLVAFGRNMRDRWRARLAELRAAEQLEELGV